MKEAELRSLIERQRDVLTSRQHADGHWVYPLEADVTIPADYIMMNHIIGRIEDEDEQKIACYIRRRQITDGGWALFHGGTCDVSASVKAYMALKLVGDKADEPHMMRARDAIAKAGGALHANIFTRIFMVLFGFLPWRAVPILPIEWIFLPRWAAFHLSKVSYWSRATIIPLMMLTTLKPRAVNPRSVTMDELFPIPPHSIKRYNINASGKTLGSVLLVTDDFLRFLEPVAPPFLRRLALNRAMNWCLERANGRDGLGGIFPPMIFFTLVCHFMGYRHHPCYEDTLAALRLHIVDGEQEGELLCQSCVSPVWDTSLVMYSQLETGVSRNDKSLHKAASWLLEREVRIKGDWAVHRPHLGAGGWAFQYRNDHYPDVDDTAMVAMALDRLNEPAYEPAIRRTEKWILGMQSKNGGWGAFDADNSYDYFNHIPFNDHGALLDPPTADVSARCISFLAQRGYDPSHASMKKAISYLKEEQEEDGSWYGRWGTNYIYGTWSAICALNAVKENMKSESIKRAVSWFLDRQNVDGGWGEGCQSYWEKNRYDRMESTASQTSWALLALMAAGGTRHKAVAKGIDYLIERAPQEGFERWEEEHYTAVGFPRVFYLRYHGYAAYFPLWALARYHTLTNSNSGALLYGM